MIKHYRNNLILYHPIIGWSVLFLIIFALWNCTGEETYDFYITKQKTHAFGPDGGCDTVYTNKSVRLFGLEDSLQILSKNNDYRLKDKYTYIGEWFKIEIHPDFNPKAVITIVKPNSTKSTREFHFIIGYGDDYFGTYPFKATRLYYYQHPYSNDSISR